MYNISEIKRIIYYTCICVLSRYICNGLWTEMLCGRLYILCNMDMCNNEMKLFKTTQIFIEWRVKNKLWNGDDYNPLKFATHFAPLESIKCTIIFDTLDIVNVLLQELFIDSHGNSTIILCTYAFWVVVKHKSNNVQLTLAKRLSCYLSIYTVCPYSYLVLHFRCGSHKVCYYFLHLLSKVPGRRRWCNSETGETLAY